MAFTPTLPVFNIIGKFWIPGNAPNMGAPDLIVDVQLYIPPRSMFEFDRIAGKDAVIWEQIRTDVAMTLLLPAPYVGGIWGWGKPDGVTWCYKVRAWDWEHESFANQYLRFDVIQCDDGGTEPDPNR